MNEPSEALFASNSLIPITRLGLVAILVASAVGKIYYKGSVDTALKKLGLTSDWLVKVITALLAPAEALIALWLASGWLPRWSTLATLVLVVAFNVVLWRLQAVGYDGGCGCFGGKSAGPVRVVHLIRNAVMLGAAATLVYHVWIGPIATLGALWALPGAVLLHAALVLGVLLVGYLLAGAAERLLFRAYWN